MKIGIQPFARNYQHGSKFGCQMPRLISAHRIVIVTVHLQQEGQLRPYQRYRYVVIVFHIRI